jgi:hypothetical protein
VPPIAERSADALPQLDRAQVDPEVKLLADGQQQRAQRDVVGHAREADCAKVDGIEVAQAVERVGGHHPAVLQVARKPSGTTSMPTPSPGMTAIR